MELLTKQVSLSLVLCLAGLGRARLTFTPYPPTKGWVMGINGPFILHGRACTH